MLLLLSLSISEVLSLVKNDDFVSSLKTVSVNCRSLPLAAVVSVTKWILDYLFNIWPFTTVKICQKHLKFTKVSLKFYPVLTEPIQNCQSFLKSCLKTYSDELRKTYQTVFYTHAKNTAVLLCFAHQITQVWMSLKWRNFLKFGHSVGRRLLT